jgi:hypothetical protein
VDAEAQLGQFISLIHSSNPANRVLFCGSDDNWGLTDLSTSKNRNSMVASIQSGLQFGYLYNGVKYKFDGYCDDIEGYPIDAASIVDAYTYYNQAGAGVHSLGKVYDVYYGVNSWPDGIQADGVVLSNLAGSSIDFVNVAFNTKNNIADTFYLTVSSSLHVPWGYQLRSYSSGDSITVSDQLQYLTSKFGHSPPAYYVGTWLWELQSTSNGGFTSEEWSVFDGWQYS